MAGNLFANITAPEVRGTFSDALDGMPQVWVNHVTRVQSNASQETHAWLGASPKPKKFVGEYQFQGLLDFKFTIVNDEFHMAFTIDQNSVQDDHTGQIQRRLSDAAKVWASWKDEQLATLLEGTGTDTYDATAFFSDSRTIGSSGTIDNNLGLDIAGDPDLPTAAEWLSCMQICLASTAGGLWTFADDQGRRGYNAPAMGELRLIVPPRYQKAAVEAMESTIISNTSNPWGSRLAAVDVIPYLSLTNDVFFLAATGDPNKRGFIYQERTPLSVNIYNAEADVVENHGMKVIVGQRYSLRYGEPRRVVKCTIT